MILNEPHTKDAAGGQHNSSPLCTATAPPSRLLTSASHCLLHPLVGRVAASAESRAVRVNVPPELGGGFTMVVCQLSQQPTVRSLTSQAIGLTQATNSSFLDPLDWGLSLPPDGSDDPDAPRVFLHPDTALPLVFPPTDDEPTVDLLRLRATRAKASPRSRRDARQAKAASTADDEGAEEEGRRPEFDRRASGVQRVSSDDAKEADRWTRVFRIHCTRQGGREERDVRFSRDPATVRSPFDPPPTPTPPHLTHVRHSLLQQLKRVHPPHVPLPSGLTCLLFPPPVAPPLLSGASSASLVANGSAGPKAKVSKEEKRREEEQKKERDKEVAAIDTLLTSLSTRGVGHYRPRPKRKGDDDEDEEVNEAEERARRKKLFAWCGGEAEVPLFFVPLQPPPANSPAKPKQKPNAADNAFVLTSLRALQLEAGVMVKELRIGPGSGGVISAPKGPVAGGADGVRLSFTVKELSDREGNVSEGGDSDDDNGGAAEEEKEEGEEEDGMGRRGRRRVVTFLLPSTPLVSYLQQYVAYMQSTLTLTHGLHCLSSPSSQTTATPYQHALLGWTMLLKSFIGPLVFGPLRLPLYTHQVKQLLARVQQMELKNVQLSSLKLLQFYLPRPELTEEGEEGEEDFIPSLSLRSFKGHPDHTYIFDISWTCPSFLVRVEIQGKKIMSFKLELEMRGIEVSGSILLRSTPYAPEQLAVSFESLPSLSFGVSSQVIVGSVRVPFQQSIERLITSQIQTVLQQQIAQRAVHPQWISVSATTPTRHSTHTLNHRLHAAALLTASLCFLPLRLCHSYFPQTPVSLLLARWSSTARFPFKFDGKDDEEMMGLALVVTTQAEQVVGDTLKEMKQRREQMEGYMTRPLYGEEGGDDWQAKEKARVLEKEREREREEAESERPKSGKKKKKAGGTASPAAPGDYGGERKTARDVVVEDITTPVKAKHKKNASRAVI